MDSTHDPVAELKRAVAAGAYAQGHAAARQRSPSRLRWLVLGFVLGVIATVKWASIAVAQVPPVAEQYRRDLARIAVSVWGLDAPIAALAAQIEQESAWRPDAISRVGAAGLTQFMPATARDIAARYGGGPPNPFDPRWAMTAQSQYMRELKGLVSMARNESERYAFALAAYNGGLGRVRQRQRLSDDPGRCLNATCDINPGISESNQRENREYPRRILLLLLPRYHAAGWGGPALHARYGV